MSGSDGYGIDVGLTKADTCCGSTGNKITTCITSQANSIILKSWKNNAITLLTSKDGLYSISLYSLDGSLIEKGLIKSNNTIAVYKNKNISKGFYLLKVAHKTNKIENTFIISN